MSKVIPTIKRHLCRPTTKASAKRTFVRVAASANAPAQSDIVNPIGGGGSGAATAHAARTQSVGTQAITGAGQSRLIFAGTVFDTDSFFSVSHNTRLTVPLAGIYLLEVIIYINSANNLDGLYMFFQINGTPIEAASELQINLGTLAGGAISFQKMITAKLSASDYVEVQVGSLTGQTISSANMSASFLGS